ncbi:MAG: T9SS type A sorting domain-containing protein [Flavobacteriales bacterium]|nr:T9SS type A sorting domain-containing protein [Flavobacteriales bacterium]
MKNLYFLLISLLLIAPLTSGAQCISTVQVGNYTASGSTFNQQQIFSCNFAGDYAIVNIPVGIWTFSTSVSTDYITLTNTSNVVLATGAGSLQFGASSAMTVRMHIFQNSSCDEQFSCRNSYVQQNAIPIPQISASDTFVCDGDGPVTLTATNLFGTQTYWYAGSCNSTPIDSGSSTVVDPASTTTYYSNNQFNGGVGECDSFTLNITPIPSVVFSSVQDVLCNGDSTGSITASTSNGSSPYSYAWNSGQTSATISDLPPGVYEVIVIDTFGCSDTNDVTISEPDALASTMAILSEPDCFGDQTGSAQVSVTGGIAPYIYSWSNGDPDDLIDNVGADTYFVDILDSNGCVLKDTAIITQPADITLALSQLVNVDCNGGSSGFMEVLAFGGAGSLTFNWSTGSTSPSISNLSAGVYTVTISDTNACEKVYSDTINEPVPLQTSFDVTDATCHDSDDGSVTVSNTGATAPYAYAWSTGGATNSINTLDTGSYVVTITDDSGCVYEESVVVTYLNEDPIIPLDSTAKLCAGFEITLDAGNEGGSFNWSTGASSQSIQVDSGGAYTVVVIDGNGCSSAATVLVVEDACVGIQENTFEAGLSLFPNPTQGELNVILGSGRKGNTALRVLTSDGRVVLQHTFNADQTSLNLSDLSKGIYFIQVEQEGGTATQQIIVQ